MSSYLTFSHFLRTNPGFFLYQGAEDGCVRMYDARAGPDHQTKFKTGKKTTAPNWVSCIVTDDDGIMAMVGTGAKRLSTVHITSSSVASSTNLDSVPATLKRLGDRVFCGSVDVGDQDKDVGAVRMFDMQCKEEGSMQTANQGVYSIAMHLSNQTAAAGGYALSQCGHYSRPSGIDVYLSPPLHSFSMPMR